MQATAAAYNQAYFQQHFQYGGQQPVNAQAPHSEDGDLTMEESDPKVRNRQH